MKHSNVIAVISRNNFTFLSHTFRANRTLNRIISINTHFTMRLNMPRYVTGRASITSRQPLFFHSNNFLASWTIVMFLLFSIDDLRSFDQASLEKRWHEMESIRSTDEMPNTREICRFLRALLIARGLFA